MPPKECAIGVDLGGTKIALGAVDGEGRVLELVRYETDARGGPDAVIDQMAKGVAHLEQEGQYRIIGMGVGVAGQIDPATGTVRFAPNLDWHDVPLQTELERISGFRAAVINDVRAALWGEWLYGAGRDAQNLICVFVGTGIGGGIVSGGQVLEGCSGTAGEIGHMTVDLHGPVCHCGNRGCMEALAGGWAIARKAGDLVRKHPTFGGTILKMAGGKEEDITARAVVQACYVGDALAREIMDEAAEAIIAGITGLVNCLNPCHIILGGGIIEGMPELISRINQGVRGRALATATRGLVVSPAKLGNDAGIIGAAAVAISRFGESRPED